MSGSPPSTYRGLLEAEDPERDVHLYVNSPGGDTNAGLRIALAPQELAEGSFVAIFVRGLASDLRKALRTDAQRRAAALAMKLQAIGTEALFRLEVEPHAFRGVTGLKRSREAGKKAVDHLRDAETSAADLDVDGRRARM